MPDIPEKAVEALTVSDIRGIEAAIRTQEPEITDPVQAYRRHLLGFSRGEKVTVIAMSRHRGESGPVVDPPRGLSAERAIELRKKFGAGVWVLLNVHNGPRYFGYDQIVAADIARRCFEAADALMKS